MKSANIILQHIRQLPKFKPLQTHYCYQKFISLLNPRHRKAIAFVYIRQNTLFIALSHPGFKMELHYNQDLLKDLLTFLSNKDKQCKHLKAKKIVLFNSKYKSIIKQNQNEDTVPHYSEKALGEFDIKSKDWKIIDAFNRIKASINKNR